MTTSGTDSSGKKKYTKPTLSQLGSISTLTLGQGGSSMDGTGSYTQKGGGNDDTGPHTVTPSSSSAIL